MTRKLYLIIIGVFFYSYCMGQISVYDCVPSVSVVSQNQIYTSNPYFYQRCIVFEENQNYIYDENSPNPLSNINIKASKSIIIEPGFTAGNFGDSTNETKSFLMDIIYPETSSLFDVVSINYDDIYQVRKHDRFELGIEIPEDILVQIKEFLNEGSTGQTNQINPYLSKELQITAEFYPLDNPNDITIKHGFHYVPYERYEPETLPAFEPGFIANDGGNLPSLLGGWTEKPTDYPFRIRFAPPTIGKWGARVHIKTTSNTISSNTFTFNVVNSSKKPPLTVGKKGKYLERGSESFIGIGNNLKWPETKCEYDLELANLFKKMQNGVYDLKNEQYKNFTPPVRTFRVFREQIDKLADGGANMFRMIMAPQGNDIEFEDLGNYSKRMNIAYEMDDILYKAEERDLLIDWNLQVHYPFTDGVFHISNWDWDDEPGDVKGHCYLEIPEVVEPIDFLKNETAKEYYKERLRYIISRWGYSNNIAMFELFSEIDQFGLKFENAVAIECAYNAVSGNNGTVICPNDEAVFKDTQEAVYKWQKEMLNYLHNELGHDKHLYTVNYVGATGEYDLSLTIPEIDIISTNTYDYSLYENTNFNSINEIATRNISKNSKPTWFSETGPSKITSNACDNQVEMLRSQWKILFSGASGGLEWSSAEYQHDNYQVFGKMNQFLSNVNLDSEGWHPGPVESTPGPWPSVWEFNDDWEKDMERTDKKGGITYLRKGDLSAAMGVITNRTYNYFNAGNNGEEYGCGEDEPELCNLQWNTTDFTSYDEMISHHHSDGRLRLRGMQAKKYIIDYYWAHNPTQVIHTSEDFGPRVKLEYGMAPSQSQYIMLFKARLKKTKSNRNSRNTEIKKDVIVEKTDANRIDVYPNPTKGKFTIHLNEVSADKMEIIDTLGRVVYSYDITSQSINIDLSNKDSGVYIIRLMTSNNVITKQLIKQ